jgi:Lrp/AsnC family leucine-responsive transcriptional regulator
MDIPHMRLDKTDLTLLARLQDNARLGLDALAEFSGVSTASVQRRLKRLREAGVITGEVAILDPARVGQPMTFVVMVELERERLDQIDAFTRRAQNETQVQQ